MPNPSTQSEFAGIEEVFNLTSGGPAPVTTTKPKKPKAEKTVDAASLPPNLGKATRLPSVDFNDPNRPLTCLEVDFPIAEINALSKQEGNAGKPIYQMSKWWARRRSCIFRAMLIAAGMKAPDDEEQAARKVWEYFYANHQKAGHFRGLKVLDPFMGGGTTLVEGSRLGYHVTGNDLNPVAWFVVKNELAGSDPEQVRALFTEIEREVKPLIHPFYVTNCPGGHQGQWLDKRTGRPADVDPVDLQPGQRKYYEWDGAEVIYTFWAKHGPCMAEGCGHRTPIFRTPVVAEKRLITEYFELRCPKTAAVYHAELGETRLAPGCERVVLENEPRFVESSQEFARMFNDYNKGNATEKRLRIQQLLELMETEPALRHPDTHEWCGGVIKATLERQQRASRASDLKKKDFNIRSKPVFMYVLLDPKWLEGTPGEIDGVKLGGYAGAEPNATARWYRERLQNLRIVEVRGRVRLAELSAPAIGQAIDTAEPDVVQNDEDQKLFGLPKHITLADGTVFDTRSGTFPESGHFVCKKDGRKQEVVEALRQAKITGPSAPYLIQCYCPKREAEGYNYGGRFFKAPTEADIVRLTRCENEWSQRQLDDLKPFWPKSKLPFARRTFQKDVIPSHGFDHWWKMFLTRQLLGHAQIMHAICHPAEDKWPLDIKQQALGAFQQYLRMMCVFSFWHRTYDKLAPAFGNPDYRTKNNFVESNPFGTLGYGRWTSCKATVIEALQWARSPWDVSAHAKTSKLTPGDEVFPSDDISCGSSTDLGGKVPSSSVDLVVTDPPFGDNLFYSDLADFFYVWLRLAFLDLLQGRPEQAYFRNEHTTKSVEVIENEAEHPDDRNDEEKKERLSDGSVNPKYRPLPAEDFYEKGLTLCWSEAFRILKPAGMLAFTFHHDEDRAWANVLRSLFEAGFLLVATYPIIADETKGDNAEFGSQKIAYDVIHVCRKRLEKPEPVSWARMRRWVREEAARLKTLLEHSHGQTLSDADLRVILRGKALEFYSRHYGQVWIGQEILGVKEALLGINQLLDDLLAEGIAATQRPPEAADPVTRLFLRLFARRTSIPRDELHKNLKGTTVDTALLADRGWVRVIGTTVHAVPVAERFQFFIAPGRNRKIIRTDLDQAQFLAGAALARSGINIEAELDRETFNVKPSVEPLLEWIAVTDASPEVRQAAALAKNIVTNWRAKEATEGARRPEAAQLELLQVAQSEA
jgi:putative DNA methylase